MSIIEVCELNMTNLSWYIFTKKFPFYKPPLQRDVIETVTNIKTVLLIRTRGK
jgi:hypothetical protein